MRAVLDSNLIISALINGAGVPARVLEAWRRGRFALVLSEDQLEELRRVTRYERLRPLITAAAACVLLNELRAHAQMLADLPHVDRSPDPADNFLLAMAQAGEADVLVETKHGSAHLASLAAPALVGEIGVLTMVSRTASIRARTRVQTVRVEGEALHRIGQENPRFLSAILAALGRRVETFNKAIGFYSHALAALREDGFGVVRKFWPPPSRRGLLLCDPSYEIKSDYERVPQLLEEALKRFATGVAAIWHPIIPRPEAHQLPKRLKALAQQAGKPWLYATLAVGGEAPKRLPGQAKAPTRLRASGVFIVNPPHTLAGQLRAALPVVTQRLGKDRHAGFQVLTQG